MNEREELESSENENENEAEHPPSALVQNALTPFTNLRGSHLQDWAQLTQHVLECYTNSIEAVTRLIDSSGLTATELVLMQVMSQAHANIQACTHSGLRSRNLPNAMAVHYDSLSAQTFREWIYPTVTKITMRHLFAHQLLHNNADMSMANDDHVVREVLLLTDEEYQKIDAEMPLDRNNSTSAPLVDLAEASWLRSLVIRPIASLSDEPVNHETMTIRAIALALEALGGVTLENDQYDENVKSFLHACRDFVSKTGPLPALSTLDATLMFASQQSLNGGEDKIPTPDLVSDQINITRAVNELEAFKTLVPHLHEDNPVLLPDCNNPVIVLARVLGQAARDTEAPFLNSHKESSLVITEPASREGIPKRRRLDSAAEENSGENRSLHGSEELAGGETMITDANLVTSNAETNRLGTKRSRPSGSEDRTEGLSNSTGAKFANVITLDGHIKFYELIETNLRSNDRRTRDWTALDRACRAFPECQTKYVKQKTKRVLQERRDRRQLRFWNQIKEAGNDPEKVIVMVREMLCQHPAIDDGFVQALAEHLTYLVSAGKKSPGNILEWSDPIRKEVTNKMVELHIKYYPGRPFHHVQSHFRDLFSLADVELGILSVCECEECESDWGITPQARANETALRLHWSREKAALMRRVLELHRDYKSQMYQKFDGSEKKFRNWTKEDVDYVLQLSHPVEECPICLDARQNGESLM
mmetsp:Transcript_10446/g.20582  ORF Transcript_10446/g.20582 Transcript_10446/m.20582 type:complete len:706 (-) Transcript_10446:125-2242(-)